MKNNQEYQKLIELRNAIIGKSQAQTNLQNIKQKQDQLQFTLVEPNRYRPKQTCTQQLIDEFDAPYLRSAKKKATRRDVKSRLFISFLWLLLTAAVVAAIGFLTYLVSIWSWNTSITSMTSKPYMGEMMAYETAVGIHLFALSVLLGVGGFIGFAMIGAENVALKIGGIIVGIGFGICCVIAFFTSFSYFYSVVSGFWETLLLAIASLLFFPKFLLALLIILPPILLTIGIIAMMMFMFYRLYCLNVDFEGSYQAPRIDRSSLMKSEAYQKAQEQDRKNEVIERANYEQYYMNELANYNQMNSAYSSAKTQYQGIINRCDGIIRNSDILHSSQKNLECINIILYYFESRRAITIREALNLYVQDERMLRIEHQLNDLQGELIRAMKTEVNRLSSRLDNVQSAITTEIATVTKTLNNQTATLEKAANKIREDNNRNAENLRREQAQMVRELGFLYTESRLHRN